MTQSYSVGVSSKRSWTHLQVQAPLNHFISPFLLMFPGGTGRPSEKKGIEPRPFDKLIPEFSTLLPLERTSPWNSLKTFTLLPFFQGPLPQLSLRIPKYWKWEVFTCTNCMAVLSLKGPATDEKEMTRAGWWVAFWEQACWDVWDVAQCKSLLRISMRTAFQERNLSGRIQSFTKPCPLVQQILF